MTTDVGRCLALIQVSTFSEETLVVHRDTHRVLLDGLTEIIAEGVRMAPSNPADHRLRYLPYCRHSMALPAGFAKTVNSARNRSLSRLSITFLRGWRHNA